MLRFILQRLQLQKELFKYNDRLLQITSQNPNGVMKILFKERDLIYNHSTRIVSRNINLNADDMYIMQKETKKLDKDIRIFLNKYK